MKCSTLKLMAFASALVVGAAISGQALAQTETVNATLTVSSAITSNDVSDMDFGTWLIQFEAGDTPVITLTSDGTAATSQTGSVANGSQVIEITDSATEGVVTVQTPAPSSLTLTRSNTVAFASGALSLASVAFRTASNGPTAINANAATGTVTVVAGATDETIRFGGTVAISATPADGIHTASFDVTLAY